IIQAVNNQQVGLNVVTELIIGYALPGRPVSMMISKPWDYITMAQALTHVRLQAGPLHEDSPTVDVLRSDCRDGYRWYHTAQCTGVDVYQCRERL
ncbi:hypothetical protein IW261DRAFT_1517049, partial [Armillaria novae-zelandiae]